MSIARGIATSIVGPIAGGRDGDPTLTLHHDYTRSGYAVVGPSLTFTRASGATMFNSDGELVWAPENLLLRSEEFDLSPWADSAGSGTVITANNRISPNNDLTADQITATNGAGRGVYQALTIAGGIANQQFTISVWVYAETEFSFDIRTRGNGSTQEPVNSTVTTEAGAWKRVTITRSFTGSADGTSLLVFIYTSTFGTINANTVWLWGAQLYRSPNASSTYIPTTSAAVYGMRTNSHVYEGGAWTNKGLLVEGQATNLVLNSNGLATQNVTVTAVAHTLSFYGTGTVTLSGTSTSGPLVGTGVSDRVSLTFTPTAGTLTLTVSGSVVKAQLEAGSFSTSYIPTTSASVTRSADVATIGGTDFSGFYNQSEGTWAANARCPASGTMPIFGVDDNSANERMSLYASGTDPKFIVVDGGVTQADVDGGAITASTSFKFASSYASDKFTVSLDGASVVDDSSGTIPTVDRMRVGVNQAGSYFNGHISSLKYFNVRKPNAFLESVTT